MESTGHVILNISSPQPRNCIESRYGFEAAAKRFSKSALSDASKRWEMWVNRSRALP